MIKPIHIFFYVVFMFFLGVSVANSSEIYSGQGRTILEAGFIDVTKAPYNADNTGVSDASSAIQQAIDDGYDYNFAVYVPAGTYLLESQIIGYQEYGYENTETGATGASNRKHSTQLIGDKNGGTILKAGPNIGSDILVYFHFLNDPSGSENTAATRFYSALVRNFTIDMGNNTGATALSMNGAQMCSIENVTITGNFKYGVKDLPGSGGSTTGLTVTGGQIGIYQTGYRPVPSLQGVVLNGQSDYGIYIEDVRGGIALAGFEIKNAGVAGVYVPTADDLSLIDGVLEGNTSDVVVGWKNSVYFNNVFVDGGVVVSGSYDYSTTGKTHIRNYSTDDDGATKDTQTVTALPNNLVAIHTPDFSKLPEYFDGLIDIRDYGATDDDDSDDDATAINAALTAGASTGKAVFIPRGVWETASVINVPVGTGLIGSSSTNSIIRAKTSWAPTSETAMVQTADAVGNVIIRDIAIEVHQPATSPDDLTAMNNLMIFHGRSSNMLVMDTFFSRKEYWAGGDQEWAQTLVRFTGNAGGRIYHVVLDHHETTGTVTGTHWSIDIDGTENPLIIYQPDTESIANNSQIRIRNSSNITLVALKFEPQNWYDLVVIRDSANIGIISGSGNYSVEPATGNQMFYVTGSNGVVIANINKLGPDDDDPLLIDDTGTVVDGTSDDINYYRLGTAILFGSGQYPPYPYLEPSEPTESGFKCGCKDTACNSSHWQIQGVLSTHYEPPTPPDDDDDPPVTGGSPYETGGQCSASQVPAAAAAQGLTYLAFCDDFSDSSSIVTGATWQQLKPAATSRERWSTYIGFGNTSNHMNAASLNWHSDGTVTIDPSWEKYQLYMSSMDRDGDGYFINEKGRFYNEVRWRFDKRGGGQPAFWSMDRCHTHNIGTCQDNLYIEPDFWEYWNAVTSIHLWVHSPFSKYSRCNHTVAGEAVVNGEWFTVGHLYTGGTSRTAAKQQYYKNNRLIYTRTVNTGGCVDFGGGTTAAWIWRIGEAQLPLFLGSKLGDVITYDYVRVWEHPDDQ